MTAGQIMSSDGMCLDATCANVSVGCVPLHFMTCNNNQNQQFIHKTDGSLTNVGNNGCIDLWDSGAGPDVGVYSCDGGTNQHWSISGSQFKSDTGDRCMITGGVKPVWVYSNADSVELYVNGISQGKQKMPFLDHVEWNTQWAAGAIQVVGYDKGGKVIGTKSIETTGAPATVVLEVEFGAKGILADKQDVALITATIVDSKGLIVPTASNKITFTVSSLGRLIGVGNGDPSSHEPDKANYRSAFNGLARAIVQSTDTAGVIEITATADGLQSGKTQVQVMASPRPIRTI